MQFTEEQIDRLKALCREDDMELTQRDAVDLAHWLVACVRAIAHPISLEDREEFERIAQEMRSTNR